MRHREHKKYSKSWQRSKKSHSRFRIFKGVKKRNNKKLQKIIEKIQ